MSASHVSRTVGFAREFEFVAEVTAEVIGGGLVVIREYGHSEWGALARAESSAASRLVARKRRAGFYEGGFEFLDESRHHAEFGFGFGTYREERS